MRAISKTHGKWVMLIIKKITQAESNDDNTSICKTIISLKSTQDCDHVATKGLRTAFIPSNTLFIQVSQLGNKFQEEAAVLCTFFARNPTPA